MDRVNIEVQRPEAAQSSLADDEISDDTATTGAPALRRGGRRRTHVPSYHLSYQLNPSPSVDQQRVMALTERHRWRDVVELRDDGFGGTGLFAKVRIDQGLSLQYFGEYISVKEADRRYPDPSMARYVLEHHRVRVDAAVMPEALARYVNHRRRRPQLAQTVSSMEVHALSPFVHFEQVRMIEAGEQIFVDYGKEYFVDAQGQPIERGFNYE
jgi:hypothetical protein